MTKQDPRRLDVMRQALGRAKIAAAMEKVIERHGMAVGGAILIEVRNHVTEAGMDGMTVGAWLVSIRVVEAEYEAMGAE